MAIGICGDGNGPLGSAGIDRTVPSAGVLRANDRHGRPMLPADVDRIERRALEKINGGRTPIDAGGVDTLAGPATLAARTLVCPDLSAASDTQRPWWNRLAHALLLGAGIAGGPDTAALKAFGLRAVERTATHTVFAAAEGALREGAGKLIVPLGARKMSEAERSAAAHLVHGGHEVVRVPESTVSGRKSPDFLVDGKPTELKTIANVTSPDLTAAVVRRIREASRQAPNVLLDVRGQIGLDEKAARRILNDVKKSQHDANITSLHIFGRGFDMRFSR